MRPATLRVLRVHGPHTAMPADVVRRRRGSPFVSREHTDQRCVWDRDLSRGRRSTGGVRRLECGVRRDFGVGEIPTRTLTKAPFLPPRPLPPVPPPLPKAPIPG